MSFHDHQLPGFQIREVWNVPESSLPQWEPNLIIRGTFSAVRRILKRDHVAIGSKLYLVVNRINEWVVWRDQQ